jgi:hypothetical protein
MPLHIAYGYRATAIADGVRSPSLRGLVAEVVRVEA